MTKIERQCSIPFYFNECRPAVLFTFNNLDAISNMANRSMTCTNIH